MPRTPPPPPPTPISFDLHATALQVLRAAIPVVLLPAAAAPLPVRVPLVVRVEYELHLREDPVKPLPLLLSEVVLEVTVELQESGAVRRRTRRAIAL